MLDEARCLFLANPKFYFSQKKGMYVTGNPANDHCIIVLVDRIIQTLKRRLACNKQEKRTAFKVRQSVPTITYQFQMGTQRTTRIFHFDAQFGRKLNTPLRFPITCNCLIKL